MSAITELMDEVIRLREQLAAVTKERDQWKREALIRWCHAQAKKKAQP